MPAFGLGSPITISGGGLNCPVARWSSGCLPMIGTGEICVFSGRSYRQKSFQIGSLWPGFSPTAGLLLSSISIAALPPVST